MNRIDIVTDIETLGKQSDSTIIQLSAVIFNIETGDIIDEFNKVIDIELEKISADGDTIKWWIQTNKEFFMELLSESSCLSLKDVLTLFNEWILENGGNSYLWGNGILFDNKMIQAQMKKHNIEYPIYYKNDRDMRTILELASIKSGVSEAEIKNSCELPELVEHNALHDCYFQAKVISKCFNIITQ